MMQDTARRTGFAARWSTPMTDRQRFWLKIGLTCAAMGVAALILPHFGLQFRKLQKLGPNAAAGAWTLIALGGVLCLPALLRIRLRMMAAIAGGVVVVGFVLMMGLGWLLSRSRSMPGPPPPTATYAPPQFPTGPGAAPGGPGPDGAPYRGPGGVPTGGPAGGPRAFEPGTRPRPRSFEERRAEVEQQYGAHRVWSVRIEGADAAVHDRLRDALREYRKADVNPGSWSVSFGSSGVIALSAPEASHEALLELVRSAIAGVDGASEPRVDEAAREIVVTVAK